MLNIMIIYLLSLFFVTVLGMILNAIHIFVSFFTSGHWTRKRFFIWSTIACCTRMSLIWTKKKKKKKKHIWVNKCEWKPIALLNIWIMGFHRMAKNAIATTTWLCISNTTFKMISFRCFGFRFRYKFSQRC